MDLETIKTMISLLERAVNESCSNHEADKLTAEVIGMLKIIQKDYETDSN